MTRHDIYQIKPASVFRDRWRDSTPLGNGHTGVALYGGTAAETLVLHRADMWHAGDETKVPDVTDAFYKMRRLEREGKAAEACNVMYDALNQAGYETNAYLMRVLGCVKFRFACDGVYRHYRRILHMDTGESEIRYCLGNREFERRCFVSRKRDMVVLQISSQEPSDFLLSQGFFSSYEGGTENYLRDREKEYALHRVSNNCIVYSSNNEGKYFGIVTKVISDGDVNVSEHEIKVKSATDTLVLIKVFSEENKRNEAEDTVIRQVIGCPTDYHKLFAEHKRLHKALYGKADLKLYSGRTFHSNEELLAEARENECSTELAEKIWRFGRYLFISGVSKKGLPFPLYGLWPCGYERLFSQHVGNENIEMIHWHAAVGGLSELVEPLVHFYCDKIKGFRENAKNLFGCSGIFVGAYLTPYNERVTPHVPVILHFLGVAGWISRHMYEYYLCTRNETLFTEKILPFMLETAQFYEDYIYEDDNGMIELYPAVSPENTPLEYLDVPRGTVSGHPMPVSKNPTIEFAILKELLTNLLEISKTHQELHDKAQIWRQMLSKIPDYMMNESGAIAEWMDENVHDYYKHRHLSHVYPVFPGTEIEDTERKDLFPAFKKAVDMRELGYMTGWSLAHMAAIYARLKEGERAFDSLNMMTKVCLLDNFFTLHNDFRDMGITTTDMGDENYAPVQLDALMGSVNAIQEMLVFVSPKKIKLLPACPKELSKGTAKFSYHSGSITLQWNLEKKLCKAIFSARRNTNLVVEFPFGCERRNLILAAGETCELNAGQSNI